MQTFNVCEKSWTNVKAKQWAGQTVQGTDPYWILRSSIIIVVLRIWLHFYWIRIRLLISAIRILYLLYSAHRTLYNLQKFLYKCEYLHSKVTLKKWNVKRFSWNFEYSVLYNLTGLIWNGISVLNSDPDGKIIPIRIRNTAVKLSKIVDIQWLANTGIFFYHRTIPKVIRIST